MASVCGMSCWTSRPLSRGNAAASAANWCPNPPPTSTKTGVTRSETSRKLPSSASRGNTRNHGERAAG